VFLCALCGENFLIALQWHVFEPAEGLHIIRVSVNCWLLNLGVME
jgi:hypothetical protein